MSRLRIFARCAEALAAHGGLLIVDEAFVDFLDPSASAVPVMPAHGMIVLRSFGKTYGLPGLRLGFAIAPKNLAEKLRAALGPWPVSGAAIAIGSKALLDRGLARGTRGCGSRRRAWRSTKFWRRRVLILSGGSMLFRLARHKDAQIWFERLAENGILVRRFEARPEWLRFGIAGTDMEIARLCSALGLEGQSQAGR